MNNLLKYFSYVELVDDYRIKGVLDFQFTKKKSEYKIFFDKEDKRSERIHNAYFSIEIISHKDFSKIPTLRILSPSVNEISLLTEIKYSYDFHMSENGEVCLEFPLTILLLLQQNNGQNGEGRNSMNQEFMERLVLPYLCSLSLFLKNKTWPTDEYSHGYQGYFEYTPPKELEEWYYGTFMYKTINTPGIEKYLKNDSSLSKMKRKVKKYRK